MNTRLEDVGLLVLRLGVSTSLVSHGLQILFGAFGGGGLAVMTDYFESVGFEPGRRSALLAGTSEVAGGTLLAVGLATPAAGAAVVGTMTVAADVLSSNGFFSNRGGLEFPATLAVAGATLSLTGSGALSFDRLLSHRLSRPWMRLGGVACGVGSAFLAITMRKAGRPPLVDH